MVSNRTIALASALLCVASPFAARGTESLFAWVGSPTARGGREASTPALPVRVDLGRLATASKGTLFEIALPTGETVRLRIDLVTRHENGDLSWVGQALSESGESGTAVGTSGEHGTFAEVRVGARTWGMAPSTQGHDWLFDKAAAEAGQRPGGENDARVPPSQTTGAIKPRGEMEIVK